MNTTVGTGTREPGPDIRPLRGGRWHASEGCLSGAVTPGLSLRGFHSKTLWWRRTDWSMPMAIMSAKMAEPP